MIIPKGKQALCIIDKYTIGPERNSMIQIEDNDLPITVAQKIIKGVKPYKPAPAVKALATALTGDEHSVDTQDMFSLEEIKEIADYLMVYYQSHINGD